jgi:hypothetical protein
MEAVYSSETLVSTYMFKWRYNPEDKHRHDRNILVGKPDRVNNFGARGADRKIIMKRVS